MNAPKMTKSHIQHTYLLFCLFCIVSRNTSQNSSLQQYSVLHEIPLYHLKHTLSQLSFNHVRRKRQKKKNQIYRELIFSRNPDPWLAPLVYLTMLNYNCKCNPQHFCREHEILRCSFLVKF